jgi:hypothetical protein
MLKKSINSAGIYFDSPKRSLGGELHLKKVFRCLPDLCGASDYGPFSSHSPLIFYIDAQY